MSRVIYWTALGLSLLFLALPLLVVLPLAFNASPFLTYPMTGVTLDWFHAVFTREPWMPAFFNSLRVGLGAAALAVVIGGLAATGTMLSGRFGQIVLSGLFLSPLVIPSVVLGVAFAHAFGQAGLGGGYLSLVLAHAILGAPLVFLSVISALKGLDPELEWAAASMGASRFHRFRTVTLPLAAPGFLTGALFAFITSFDEVVVALFLAAPQSMTLPIALFAGLRDRLEPTIVAVALLLSVLSFLFLVALNRLQRRSRLNSRGK